MLKTFCTLLNTTTAVSRHALQDLQEVAATRLDTKLVLGHFPEVGSPSAVVVLTILRQPYTMPFNAARMCRLVHTLVASRIEQERQGSL